VLSACCTARSLLFPILFPSETNKQASTELVSYHIISPSLWASLRYASEQSRKKSEIRYARDDRECGQVEKKSDQEMKKEMMRKKLYTGANSI